MKTVFAEFDQGDELYVKSYGFEEISRNAHWGRGSRGDFIVHYVMEGEGFFNSKKVKSGQGFLITPHLMHEYHSSKDNPWKYFWVIFSGSRAGEICEKYIHTDKNCVFDFKTFEWNVLDLANRIMGSEKKLMQTRALGYFYLLLSCYEEKADSDDNPHVMLAEKYMKTHIYRRIAVAEVAKLLGISDRYLYNLFVQYRGISPKQYMNQLKVERAQVLLKTTRDTVSEIGASVGFDDVLAFSRFFKNQVGASPKKFRMIYGTKQ